MHRKIYSIKILIQLLIAAGIAQNPGTSNYIYGDQLTYSKIQISMDSHEKPINLQTYGLGQD